MSASFRSATEPVADPTAQVVAAAERLLTRRTGAQVQLVDAVDLGGSERTVVLRVRMGDNPFSLPRTMVVKQVLDAAELAQQRGVTTDEAFLRETVSYQFANSLPLGQRPGAVLVAHDLAERVLVLSDLGGTATLSDLLAGHDAVATQHGLMAWAQALGRMHAVTAGREPDFRALLRRTGHQLATDPMDAPARLAVRDVPDGLRAVLGVVTPAPVLAAAQRATRLVGPEALRAFSPADLCPDNALLTAGGVQFLDYEWGGFRDVTLDAAYALVPFPGCWCCPEISAEQSISLVQAWRSEVVGVWPQLADDAALRARLLDAQLLWTWISTHWFLPGLAVRRAPSSEHPLARGPERALQLRWNRLSASAAASGEEATAEHAATVAGAIGAAALSSSAG